MSRFIAKTKEIEGLIRGFPNSNCRSGRSKLTSNLCYKYLLQYDREIFFSWAFGARYTVVGSFGRYGMYLSLIINNYMELSDTDRKHCIHTSLHGIFACFGLVFLIFLIFIYTLLSIRVIAVIRSKIKIKKSIPIILKR